MSGAHFALPPLCVAATWLCFETAHAVENPLVVCLCLLLALVALLYATAGIVNLASVATVHRSVFPALFFKRSALAAVSTMFALMLFEAFLQQQAHTITYNPNHPPAERPFIHPLTLPNAWEFRAVEKEHAVRAYNWHGSLHAHSGTGMRLLEAPARKKKDTLRIIVVGDSMTYGVGVPFEEAYPGRLQELLAERYRVEVLNLGIAGKQSEEIERIVRAYVPSLQPDLIVYGVCLNDFLPAGSGETRHEEQLRLPLPAPVARLLIDKTRVGRFLARGWIALLLKLGIEQDFVGEIREYFDEYKSRFARDVSAMNRFVTTSGLPSVVAMVLLQSPALATEASEIVQSAETSLTEAGMTVVPSSAYLPQFQGRNLRVSPWENHPNSTAHAIFAAQLAETISQLPLLERYRK